MKLPQLRQEFLMWFLHQYKKLFLSPLKDPFDEDTTHKVIKEVQQASPPLARKLKNQCHRFLEAPYGR